MGKFFYSKLALSNIKKNSKGYVPFIITCVITIMMFYIMYFLYSNEGLKTMRGGTSLHAVLGLGVIVVAVFAVIFLFYTNSFLVKRRKKEFGLYNVLGMEKRHLAKVIGLETLYVFIVSMIAGLVLGVLFSKLMALILCKLLGLTVTLSFGISWSSVLIAVIGTVAIFVLMFLNDLRHIHFAKPIELLRGGNVGEKEPKTKWILAILGIACLLAGYYIAIVTEKPLDALMLFFVAVILVIVGTYLVFIAGSIALLKFLRRNKKYYYNKKHFTSVSGMIYRMKQNAVGLASICVLSTMVLVMISTTVCLYWGLDDTVNDMYPRDISVEVIGTTEQSAADLGDGISKLASEKGISEKDVVEYRFLNIASKVNADGGFDAAKGDASYAEGESAIINLMTFDEYKKVTGEASGAVDAKSGNSGVTTDVSSNSSDTTLGKSEILVYSPNKKYEGNSIKLGQKTFKIKKHIKKLNVEASFASGAIDIYYFILPNEETAYATAASMDGTKPKDSKYEFSYYYGFNTDASAAEQSKFTESLDKLITSADGKYGGTFYCKEDMKKEMVALFGGLFFMGLFLGMLFMMATVLIIYYKQISEGYDDKERFEIMQNVGMSRTEVKRSIRSQVLTVFFLPLILAGVHIFFAFKMIVRMLAAINLTNIALFAWCTVGALVIFAIFYAIVYMSTARVYYKIVK